MPADAFEKTSWGWQVSQFQKQVGEWFEYQFSRFDVVQIPPKWSIAPWLLKLFNLIFWLILSLFLIWLGWQLWRKFSPDFYSWLARSKNATTQAQSTETELFGVQWLKRSQELSRQGDYRQACRCLYLAMLQHLHEKGILPYKPSRTDGEYLQLLHMSVATMQPYETLITTHEQLCFGNAEIVSENYEHCQQAYQEIAKT